MLTNVWLKNLVKTMEPVRIVKGRISVVVHLDGRAITATQVKVLTLWPSM